MRIVDDRGRRLLYGLVADSVDRVRVAGVTSAIRPVVSRNGRLFFTPLNTSYIDLAALDAGGQTLGTLGGCPGAVPPLSYDDARATGNPAAFAPTAVKSRSPSAPAAPRSAPPRLNETAP